MAELVYKLNDVIRMRFRGRYYGERFELVQHMRYKSTDARTAEELTQVIPGQFLTNFTAMMVVQCVFYEVGWTRVGGQHNEREEVFGLGNIPGTQNQDGLPHQLASLYKTLCFDDGQFAHGRLYMPGIPRDRFAGGTFTGAAIVQLTSIATALTHQFAEGGSSFHIEWGVLKNARSGPRLWFPMQTCSYSTLPATMRSRRPSVH